ncbi:hypothetical protein ON010_g1825 [Phytophthora cinnamomi]|nr:hypothetical protein ON010_g1825 [Phytophthora cinnamomi]
MIVHCATNWVSENDVVLCRKWGSGQRFVRRLIQQGVLWFVEGIPGGRIKATNREGRRRRRVSSGRGDVVQPAASPHLAVIWRMSNVLRGRGERITGPVSTQLAPQTVGKL